MSLRCLLPEDCNAVRDLLTACFDRTDRTGQTNRADLVQTLRDSGDMPLELVWTEGVQIRGHLGFARHESPAGWWSLATLAVHPRSRKRGIEDELIRHGLDLARQYRAKAVTAVGDPVWFRRFGFSDVAAQNLVTPSPPGRTLLYPIRPGMAGVTADLLYPRGLPLD